MGVASSMLKNKIYLFDKWLSSGENMLYLLSLLIISVTMINFEVTLFYGIGLLSLICFYMVFIKMKINSKEWQLDKSAYDVPIVEEILVVDKNFYWDGSLQSYHVRSVSSKPNVVFIEKNTELKVISVVEIEDDWRIMLKKGNGEIIISVHYLESKKYFKTKSQIREDKLNKLLK